MKEKLGRGEWILVVEDDQYVSDLLRSLLEVEGFNVVVASDGEEGERCYQSHQPRFDIVVTDLGLPKIGGVELFHRLRSFNPSVKVIASSGYGHEIVVKQLLQDGAMGFVPKPFMPQELLKLIRGVLDA
jgi:DNA-binding response OmpR family regulator